MSQENIEIVKGFFDALTRMEPLEAIDAFCADDIDYRAAEGAIDDRGPIHGKAALSAFVQDWLDTFDEVRLEPLELIDAGADQVVAIVRFSGRAKLSGIDSEMTYAEFSTIRDGKVAQGRQYWTRDEALEAAGLSE
jgi:ketosteroid isomerase-like protein